MKSTPSNSIFATAGVKSRRRLQDVEIYSKLYYTDRIQPVVAERLKALKSIGAQVNAADRLDIVKKITRDLFEDESDDIKMEVATRVAEAQKMALSEEQEEEAVRTAQQYQE